MTHGRKALRCDGASQRSSSAGMAAPAAATIHEIVASFCSGGNGNVFPAVVSPRSGRQSFLRALQASGAVTIRPNTPTTGAITLDYNNDAPQREVHRQRHLLRGDPGRLDRGPRARPRRLRPLHELHLRRLDRHPTVAGASRRPGRVAAGALRVGQRCRRRTESEQRRVGTIRPNHGKPADVAGKVSRQRTSSRPRRVRARSRRCALSGRGAESRPRRRRAGCGPSWFRRRADDPAPAVDLGHRERRVRGSPRRPRTVKSPFGPSGMPMRSSRRTSQFGPRKAGSASRRMRPGAREV